MYTFNKTICFFFTFKLKPKRTKKKNKNNKKNKQVGRFYWATMANARPLKRPCLGDQPSTSTRQVQPNNCGVKWHILRTHTLQCALNEYYVEKESRENGKRAECGAVIALNYLLLKNGVNNTLYVLQRTLTHDFSHHICQSAPLVDRDGTDVLRLVCLPDGEIMLDARLQVKDLQKKSALHFNNLSYVPAAIMRISKRMNINMETEMGTFKKYISPNIIIVTPDDASAPSTTTIDDLQFLTNNLPGFDGTTVSHLTFSWADVEPGEKYINKWLQEQDNKPTPAQQKKVQDGRGKVLTDLKEMLQRYVRFCPPLIVPRVDATKKTNPFAVLEKQFANVDIAPGLGKTRLAFKACLWMLAMANGDTNLQCMIVMGSNNVEQYMREAAAVGVSVDDIQIIKHREDKITSKKILLLSPYVALTTNFNNVNLLFTIIDEAHKYHTANGANIDRKSMYRSHLIEILSKHTKYGMLMTGTPLHGQRFDKNRMVCVSMKTAADMGIGMLPEVGVLVLPRHNGLRHRIFFRHVVAKRKQFLYDNAMIRVNNIKAAELMANRLVSQKIPVCRYFDKYREEFPTHKRHKIIITVNACNGNVDIPSCCHVIDLDQMDAATCGLTQLMTRSCRIAYWKLLARFTMVQFTDQSAADYVWPAVGGFASRAGLDVRKLPLSFVPLADINVDNIIDEYNVKHVETRQPPSDMRAFEELENCTIDTTKNYTQVQVFVDKIAAEIRMTEDEKEQARLLAVELRKQQTLTNKKGKHETKETKKTQQLSDLKQLELGAEKKEMPSQSKRAPPEERNLAQKWRHIQHRPDSSDYKLIMAENSKYPCLRELLKQHDAKPKRGTKTPDGDIKVDIPALENALGKVVVSSPAYKAHSDLNDGQRVIGLLGYLCNNENAYPKRSHTKYGMYAMSLKGTSNNCKADRMYINAFKEHLPESVRVALKMDRWNNDGTWP